MTTFGSWPWRLSNRPDSALFRAPTLGARFFYKPKGTIAGPFKNLDLFFDDLAVPDNNHPLTALGHFRVMGDNYKSLALLV